MNIDWSVNKMDMMNLEEIFDIIKNISSSISHKKNSGTLRLRDSILSFLAFIYEAFLIKIYMNANIMKTQRSIKVT